MADVGQSGCGRGLGNHGLLQWQVHAYLYLWHATGKWHLGPLLLERASEIVGGGGGGVSKGSAVD